MVQGFARHVADHVGLHESRRDGIDTNAFLRNPLIGQASGQTKPLKRPGEAGASW